MTATEKEIPALVRALTDIRLVLSGNPTASDVSHARAIAVEALQKFTERAIDRPIVTDLYGKAGA
jgi:hypothetical protein